MESSVVAATAPPLFRAVASSTRQLSQLLKCINFSNGKVHVEITEDGIKFAADHSRVMQGAAFLDKALFTTYTLNLPPSENEEEESFVPSFQIALPALLETLAIFGATDHAARVARQDAAADAFRSNIRNYHRPGGPGGGRGGGGGGGGGGGSGAAGGAFSHAALGVSGTCSLSYREPGAPFAVVMDETGVRTTCDLATYVPDAPDDIPFDRDALAFKIITHPGWLLRALTELAPASPQRLRIVATRESPYLTLSGSGPVGSASVDFARGRDLLESFAIEGRWVQSFKYDMIRAAAEAMKIATKVSFRGDDQGVLSLQFMVEVDGGGASFLDFRFVPYAKNVDEGEEDDDEEEDDDAQ